MNALRGLGALFVFVGLGLAVAAFFVEGGGLLVTGASLLLTGTIFYFTGKRTGRIVMLQPRLLEFGVPSRGLVTKIWETGVTVGNNPVLGFELNVLDEDGPPRSVAVQQAVPRYLVGAVLPGSMLAVESDPNDSSKIAIDWSIAPERPAVATDGVGDPLQDLPTRTASVADLLATGREARGIITSMRRMGGLADLGLVTAGEATAADQLFLVELEVFLAGRDPIPARVLHRVPDHLVGRVGPGLEVPLRVSRERPEDDLAIVWDRLS